MYFGPVFLATMQMKKYAFLVMMDYIPSNYKPKQTNSCCFLSVI